MAVGGGLGLLTATTGAVAWVVVQEGERALRQLQAWSDFAWFTVRHWGIGQWTFVLGAVITLLAIYLVSRPTRRA